MPVRVIRDQKSPGCWCVEEMDYDGRTLFTGQNAEHRARKYAEWLSMRVEHSIPVDAWWEA